jgi:hypothetical protein
MGKRAIVAICCGLAVSIAVAACDGGSMSSTRHVHGSIEDIGSPGCGGYYNVDIEDSHGNLLKLVRSSTGKTKAFEVCIATYEASVPMKDGYIVTIDQDPAFARQPVSASALDKNGGSLPELTGVR